jgi:hypothetical protein
VHADGGVEGRGRVVRRVWRDVLLGCILVCWLEGVHALMRRLVAFGRKGGIRVKGER